MYGRRMIMNIVCRRIHKYTRPQLEINTQFVVPLDIELYFSVQPRVIHPALPISVDAHY
jgi:hypothetical protein